MAGKLHLDDFIALNDEIAALVRAGIPLGDGLAMAAAELPGRLGRLSADLASRVSAGQPLETALREIDAGLSPQYRALIAAGQQSGHLAEALQAMSRIARRQRALQRSVLTAAAYPATIALAAYAMVVISVVYTTPRFAHLLDDRPTGRVIAGLQFMADHVWWWAPWIPVAGLLLFIGWYARTVRGMPATGSAGRPRRRSGRRSLASLRWNASLSLFAETLALLVEHAVPLPAALRLAGDSSLSHSLSSAASAAAEDLTAGRADAAGSDLPPRIRWLLRGPSDRGLAAALRQIAAMYETRAEEIASWLRLVWPLCMTAGVGGVIVAAEAVFILGPWYQVLYELTSLF